MPLTTVRKNAPVFFNKQSFAISLCIIALTALLGAPASAQNADDAWTPLKNNPDCTFWNVTLLPGALATWSGACENGRVSGQGVLELKGESSDVRVEGEFLAGKQHGHGVFVDSNGNTYTGEFKDGKLHGHGVSFSPRNNSRYEGEFRDGAITGRGVIVVDNQVRYEGEFKNGKMHGYGVFELLPPETYRYEGEYKENDQHGYGIITFTNGSRYEGELRNDMLHGHGIATRANGDTCEGEWQEDVLQGFGNGLKDGRQMKCHIEDKTFIFSE